MFVAILGSLLSLEEEDLRLRPGAGRRVRGALDTLARRRRLLRLQEVSALQLLRPRCWAAQVGAPVP